MLHTYDRYGFRHTYDSEKGNIIALGDSFTLGALVSDTETYPHLLDRWSPGTAFHNYGMDGYKTENELMVYGNVSDRYDHRLLILGYYAGNDIQTRTAPLQPQYEVRDGTSSKPRNPAPRTTRDGTDSTQSPTIPRSTRCRRRWRNTR